MGSGVNASRSSFTNSGKQFLSLHKPSTLLVSLYEDPKLMLQFFCAQLTSFYAADAEADDERLLVTLPSALQTTFHHIIQQRHPFYRPNTQAQVLHNIMAWVRGEMTGGECIYWLNGVAGTGKPTIAR